MIKALNWLALMRIPGVFTAQADIFAGFLIAGAGQKNQIALFYLIMASSFLYSAGMILNDYFDLNEDRLLRPERPLPSGRIKAASALKAGLAFILLGNLFALAAGIVSFFISLVLSLLIFTYDGMTKRHPVIGPLNMGGCRYFNLLLGLSVVDLKPFFALIPLLMLIYIFGVTFLSRMEAVGGKSRGHVGVAMVSMAGVGVLYFFLHAANVLPNKLGLILWLLCFLFQSYLVFRLCVKHTPEDYQSTIKNLLISIILLDGIIAIGAVSIIPALFIWLLIIPVKFSGRIMAIT